MSTINLWNFYPWCKEDTFVEITDEMLEAMKAADRQESTYKLRTDRYKAHCTPDTGDVIENMCIVQPDLSSCIPQAVLLYGAILLLFWRYKDFY